MGAHPPFHSDGGGRHSTPRNTPLELGLLSERDAAGEPNSSVCPSCDALGQPDDGHAVALDGGPGQPDDDPIPTEESNHHPQASEEDDLLRSEFVLWRVYDAGGPLLSLKVRYWDEHEVPYWQDGPDLFTALEQAAAEGWEAFNREPGNLPGEYAIIHLKRDGRRAPAQLDSAQA